MDSKRTRNWMTIVYPESAPENWQTILSESCVPAIVSPLHDKDVNPDGTQKKPHWHVMLFFNGVKSQLQVHELVDKFGGIKPQAVSNAVGQARYLIHKDNPEKYQYDPAEIQNFSGADWNSIVQTSGDVRVALREMVSFIKTNHIYYFRDFLDYCLEHNLEWFDVAMTHTYGLKEYCVSGNNKRKDGMLPPRPPHPSSE